MDARRAEADQRFTANAAPAMGTAPSGMKSREEVIKEMEASRAQRASEMEAHRAKMEKEMEARRAEFDKAGKDL